MDSFQLPKPERHYAKVINCIIDIFGVNYFRTVAHGQATSFSKKKQVFLKLTIFFILTNNHIQTKWTSFSDSTSKNNGNVAMGTFLDFADTSNYGTFEVSAWKRSCTISFEIQMPQTSPAPFWKVLTKFYQWTNFQTSNGPYNFYKPMVFFTFLKSITTSLCLYKYINTL